MKSNYRIGAACAAMIAAAGITSSAQAAPVVATAQAKAEIVQALNVTNTAPLDFGKIAINTAGTGGTVAVSTANAVTCAAALSCYSTASAAAWDITGSVNKTLTVKFPLATKLLRAGGVAGTAADELELANYTTNATQVVAGGLPVAQQYTLALDNTGAASLKVGGTLTVDGTEVEGVYSTTLSFDIDYQ